MGVACMTVLQAQVSSISENFNSGTWPSGWVRSSSYVGINGSTKWIYSAFNTGDGQLSIHDIVTPEIADIASKEISFEVLNNYGSSLKMEVYLSATNANTDASAYFIQEITLDEPGEYYQFIPVTIDFSGMDLSAAAGKNYIRFRVFEESGIPYGIGIDNVELKTHVNADPTFVNISSDVVDEHSPINTVVGTFSTIDPDAADSHTYQLSGTDAGRFNLNGDELRTSQVFDFEQQSSYSLVITSNDGRGGTFARLLTINVADVNEAPTGIQLSSTSVARGGVAGTVVGNITITDVDQGDNHTISLGGVDASAFQVQSGQLKTQNAITATSQSSFSIIITAVDREGEMVSKPYTITVDESSVNGVFSYGLEVKQLVHPNPAQDLLEVPENTINITFYNMEGLKEASATPLGTQVIIPEHIAPGVYLVLLDTHEGLFSQKLIVE